MSRFFRASADSPASARHFVTESLGRIVSGQQLEDARLVVTELATNAVVHAQSSFKVTIQVGDDHVCLSVKDASPEFPTRYENPDDGTGGRGLRIVARLADEWGVERRGTGKRVWARLAVTAEHPVRSEKTGRRAGDRLVDA